ncbi:hypothetical protein N7516_010378 [Penicillium verrucosum]|uniref:uncharacterized protein n=1 Tax=Penicillium verrucosum TaxID=60171 RepID=UPI0025454633|nr:uncharacterized protein N7516_010378 [Penicillium verrucosum]KAJ5922675.1 hypothetical protein N7516_010378 [Penicillium verrucosum]
MIHQREALCYLANRFLISNVTKKTTLPSSELDRSSVRLGFDFDDTYAPVARLESTRLFLSIIDYTTTYLNALINERCVFIRSPTGYKTPGKVCMINQAIMKRSNSNWRVLDFNNCLMKDIFFGIRGRKSAYGEDVGKVGWLTMRTRLDIAFALLRYLKGAPDYGVKLAVKEDGLIGYVDSSYNDYEDGKSTEAYIFYYTGAPVL